MNEFDPARDEPNPDRRTDVSDESPIEADELVEEVSIDGMCGVY